MVKNKYKLSKEFKTYLVFLCLLIIPCSLLSAFDFSLRFKPYASFPMGDGNTDPFGNEMYSMGGGGDIGLEIDFSTIWPNPLGLGYTLGAEGGMMINPMQNDSETNVSFYSFGGALGLYFFPLSRLYMRADGSVGVYQSASGGEGGDVSSSEPDLFWRAGGELGFRFTPNFLIAANAGWKEYKTGDSLLNSGAYAGLTAQLTFNAGRTSEGVGASLEQYGAVYPAFMQVYQNSPIGNIVIRNNENAEIRDVRVSFRAGNYTSSEFPCSTISNIPRGRKVNVPLLADFSPDILRFTDSGRIIGEIVIRYKFLGQQRETVRPVTVAVHDRNTITAEDGYPQDISALAAFISPTSPETLDFARFVSGISRTNSRVGHNSNMQYAVWLLECLRASGIQLKNSNNELAANKAQFPAETLLFRSGSSRDLALLFAACLEGVGIGSAFITIDEELFVAVSLDANASQAQTLFNGTEKILIINGNIWMPLSMDSYNDGFIACWTQAAEKLNRAFKEEKWAEFIIVSDAWAVYSPALLPQLGRNVIRTDNAAATREVNRVFTRYIEQEINPLIRAVSGGQGSLTEAARQNRLGILYARAGRIADAKAAYERAAGLGSVPAMTNRGNLALTERDIAAAERWFRQALQRDSQNRAALRGLERVATGR